MFGFCSALARTSKDGDGYQESNPKITLDQRPLRLSAGLLIFSLDPACRALALRSNEKESVFFRSFYMLMRKP